MARKKQRPLRESSSSAGEPVSEVTLDRLLGALPEQLELTPLRQALLRASVPDPSRAWAPSSAYATFDKRTLSQNALREVVLRTAREEQLRLESQYSLLAELLDVVAQGNDASVCLALLRIGEAVEAREDLRGALAYYEAAARFSARTSEHLPRIMALRLLARTQLALGDMDSATAYYRATLEQGRAAQQTEWQIVALTGLGNVVLLQGKWSAAIEHYQAASDLCGGDFAHLRAQLAINLASMYRELGELTESASQLAKASGLWSELTRSEQSAWFDNRGLLALARDEYDAAETSFRQALEVAEADHTRAKVLDNMAELFIRQGRLSEADNCARAGEEVALRAESPQALAEIYTRLGKISRLRSDLNGVTFFEKALELCRGRTYPITEANAYLEYGIFRRILGDVDEARSCIERAAELCAEIGAEQLQRLAAEQLTLIQ
jgi:tetratricopeptide (TPR) repeat protein